jgi:hypothetical protein
MRGAGEADAAAGGERENAMSYFPPEMPHPAVTADSKGFWEACRRRELVAQRCTACGGLRHPPEPCCPRCRSFAFAWHGLSGRGRIFSYAIVHRPYLPALEAVVPYAVIVVELEDAPGVRIISNLVDAAPEEARIGLEVEVVWDEMAAEVVVPRFRPAGGGR